MNTLFEKYSTPSCRSLTPTCTGEVVGQDHLLGEDKPIGRMKSAGTLTSTILWGPPGTGKTTIARLLAEDTDLHFEPLSAVFSGVADLRKVFYAAKSRRQLKEHCCLLMRCIDLIRPSKTVSCLMLKMHRCSVGQQRRTFI